MPSLESGGLAELTRCRPPRPRAGEVPTAGAGAGTGAGGVVGGRGASFRIRELAGA